MGGFYASVQIRTEDRETVLASAEQIAAQYKLRMLVGPVVNGWIGVYPENSDEHMGARFAELLPAYVLEVLVHDDDVFVYWLYHERKLADSFFSRPGYFEEKDKPAEEAMTGNPQAFIPIAPNSTVVLTRLLDRQSPRPTFEVETLLAFGKALGISNLVTAYDYLVDGEREGIKGWRKFTEIPQSAAREAAAAKRARKRQIKADMTLLKESGVLLAQHQDDFLMTGACPAGNGFLVSWMPNTLRQFNPPWDKPTTPPLPPQPVWWPKPVSGSNGRRIALATDKLEIWEWRGDEWGIYTDIVTSGAPSNAAISPDGSRVSCYLAESLNIFDIESKELLFRTQTDRSTGEPHIHPSGKWLVLSGSSLALIPLAEPGAPRKLVLTLDVEAQVELQRKSMDDALLQQTSAAAGRPEAERQIAEYRARMDQMLAALRKHMTTTTSHERIYRIGLTPDGHWLWGHSSLGLLVFAWSKLLCATGAHLPPPTWKFHPSRSKADTEARHFCGVTSQADSKSLVAGDSLGRLYKLDLITGISHPFFDHPRQPPLHTLILSVDQKTLGVGSRADTRRQLGDSTWEIFDFEKLQAGTSER